MSDNTQKDQELLKLFRKFYNVEPISFETINTSHGDKDFRELIGIINEAADEYVCVTPNSDGALPAEELKAEIEKTGKSAVAAESIKEGVSLALEKAGEDGMVCAVGSLYMAGDIRACFDLY